MHEPQTDPRSTRPHVHLIVRKQGREGQRLAPRKADLAQWRLTFAERLRQRGIAASATTRVTRGELAGKRRWDDALRAFALQVASTPPSERSTAFETEVLRAWYEVAGALSRSEDPQDRALAHQTLRFVGQMPIVAQRQLLLRGQDYAGLEAAFDAPHPNRNLPDLASTAQRQGCERNR